MKFLRVILVFYFIYSQVNLAQGQPLYQIPFSNIIVSSETPTIVNYHFDPSRQSIICSTDSSMSVWSYAYVSWHEHIFDLKKNHPAVLKHIDPQGKLEIGFSPDGGGIGYIKVSCSYSNM